MARKPANLIYGEDERPPMGVLLLLGVQHVFLMTSTLALPVVLVSEIGGGFHEVRSVVGLTMIACGLGTILQAMRFGWLGSGFLCPNLCGPNFFAASMEAAWLGGLPLVRGMTIIAGLFEAVFARVLHRLHFLFPPEITGLVVLMVAEGLVPLGASKFLGISYAGEPISGAGLVTAAVTLLAMAGTGIWTRGRLRLYSVIIGLACGYLLSLALGLFAPSDYERLAVAPWVALPRLDEGFTFAFRWSLLPAFLIVSVTGALKSFGNLIMCEKVNDEEWSEPEIKRISGGLMADSFCVTISGLVGGMASDTSASNVALGSASGATSRVIGYVAGAMFLLLGFSPKIAAIFSIMPMPVMGAILVYVTCFMVISGMQIILSSGMDNRKIFVVGIPFIFGVSLSILPALYADLPYYLRPLFDSPLTLATVMAVLLNQFFALGRLPRLGISGKRREKTPEKN
jgi:NCS2 family nucleobase:cation symporter-2